MKTSGSPRRFQRKPGYPRSLAAQDRELIESLGPYGYDIRFFTGNAVIDVDHQRLFDDVNVLRAALICGRSVHEVDALIDALMRDIVRHFQIEEEILATAGYPGIAGHAATHRDLANQAAARIGQCRAGTLGIGELYRFLVDDIVIRHALEADSECRAWLRPY